MGGTGRVETEMSVHYELQVTTKAWTCTAQTIEFWDIDWRAAEHKKPSLRFRVAVSRRSVEEATLDGLSGVQMWWGANCDKV